MDELQKQRAMAGLIGFNLTVIFYHLAYALFAGTSGWGEFGTRLAISVGLGLVVAAIAYLGTQMLQK